MIARTWRGWTRAADEERYAEYVRQTGLTEYRDTPGNRAAYLFHRTVGERAEFLAVSFWDSLDAVRGFAGDEIERAVFYPEDDEFLVEREMTASHWDVTEA